MRGCLAALGLPSTMPAEPPMGSAATWMCPVHRQTEGLVSLQCPVPKASPCPSPQTPRAAAATEDDQTPRSSFVTTR